MKISVYLCGVWMLIMIGACKSEQSTALPNKVKESGSAELIKALHQLKQPPFDQEFTRAEWEQYIQLAKRIQQESAEAVGQALDEFMRDQERDDADLGDRKAFILLRVVFELPESVPIKERRVFIGFSNWPSADAAGNVNLSWPVSWQSGGPKLIASLGGSQGPPYAARREFEHLRSLYPYRKFPE